MIFYFLSHNSTSNSCPADAWSRASKVHGVNFLSWDCDWDDVWRTSSHKNVDTCSGRFLFSIKKKKIEKKKHVHLFIWFYRLSLKVHLHHSRHLKKDHSSSPSSCSHQHLSPFIGDVLLSVPGRNECGSHSKCERNKKNLNKTWFTRSKKPQQWYVCRHACSQRRWWL